MWSLATMETLSSPSEKEPEAKSSAEAAKRESEEAGRKSVVAKVARERKDCKRKFLTNSLESKIRCVYIHCIPPFPCWRRPQCPSRSSRQSRAPKRICANERNHALMFFFSSILEKVTTIAHRVLMSGSSMQGKAALAPVLPKSDASSTLVSPVVSSVNSVLYKRAKTFMTEYVLYFN